MSKPKAAESFKTKLIQSVITWKQTLKRKMTQWYEKKRKLMIKLQKVYILNDKVITNGIPYFLPEPSFGQSQQIKFTYIMNSLLRIWRRWHEDKS